VQKRARIAIAQSELSNLNKAVKAYQVTQGKYPASSAEWTQLLKDANMYTTTRDGAKKAFMICYNPTDYAIIASTPILNEVNGEIHYFVSSTTGSLSTFSWNTATPGTYTIDRGCAQMPFTHTASHWTFMI
jgi:hypothetical protein